MRSGRDDSENILKITYRDRINNEEVPRTVNQNRVSDNVTERKIRLPCHVLRMLENRHALAALQWTPAEGKRKQERPKKTWRSTFKEDLNSTQIKWSDMHCCIGQNKLEETCRIKCHMGRERLKTTDDHS